MLIIDGHEDIATSFVALGRDFTQPVAVTRAREGDNHPEGICTLGLPDALNSGVGLVFGTLFVAPAQSGCSDCYAVYHDAEEAHQLACRQLEHYRDLARHPQIRLVHNRGDLHQLKATWGSADPQLGIVVLMENADPIRTPAEAGFWFERGVRIVGPAWRGTRYSGGTGDPGPLTRDGRMLMRELERNGLTLDVSHMAEESFWQALDLFGGTVIASHSNCRALMPGTREDRHLSDAMIQALVARDAVIGIVLYNQFLAPDWNRTRGKQSLGLEAMLHHVDHICQLAGDACHVAIGSDFDGGFGSESIPRELDTVADLPRIAEALSKAGYADAAIAGIMGTNWLRLLERSLPA